MKATAAEIIARLDAYTTPGPGDCLLWTANSDADGYGWAYFPGWGGAHGREVSYPSDGTLRIHVLAYLVANDVEQIDPAMHVDHQCFRRLCCNPNHLRLIPARDNVSHRHGRSEHTVRWAKKNRAATERRRRVAVETMRRLQEMGVENLPTRKRRAA